MWALRCRFYVDWTSTCPCPTVSLPTRIFLTGFMGSGKSTLGPIIANVLGYDFLDLDHYIEATQKTSIKNVFRESGEGGFREIERAALLQVKTKTDIVISLGGGAVCYRDNLRIARDSGLVVYLKVSPDRLARRLLRARVERPLLQGDSGKLSEAELRERIMDMLAARSPYYEQADVVVPVEPLIGITVDRVVNELRQYSARSTIGARAGKNGGDGESVRTPRAPDNAP
jgi:shikimate kinase